jgi:hypothetical protein
MGIGGHILGDTWTWDGSSWRQRHPSVEPSARAGAGMTYFPDRKLVLMWGGWDGRTQNSDFWSWDGTVWAPIGARDVPPAEDQSLSAPAPILTYDSARHLVVLIRNNGSHPAGPKTPDVWTWDGAKWSHPTLTGAPRIWGTGAYDPVRGAIVFFGVDAQQSPQTWAVSENVWTELTSVSAPKVPLDEPYPIVYVKTENTVALIDGSGGVWLWITKWAQLSGSQQLAEARGSSVVFDAARGLVVRFAAGRTSTWNGRSWKDAA